MKALFLLTFNFLFLAHAYADDSKLSLCNGVWTTKSCDNPEKSFDAINRAEKKSPEGEKEEFNKPEKNVEFMLDDKSEEKKDNSSAEKEQSADSKKSISQPNINTKELMRPLLLRVDQIKTKYKKNFDISKTKFICEAKDLDLEKCRSSIEDDLEKARDYELNLEQPELEVKQVDQDKKILESNEQNVVTINNVTTQISRDTEVNINKVENVNLNNFNKDFGKNKPKSVIVVDRKVNSEKTKKKFSDDMN